MMVLFGDGSNGDDNDDGDYFGGDGDDDGGDTGGGDNDDGNKGGDDGDGVNGGGMTMIVVVSIQSMPV